MRNEFYNGNEKCGKFNKKSVQEAVKLVIDDLHSNKWRCNTYKYLFRN